MTKQDEKLRQRRRLQERAIDVASMSRWDEAVEINRQIIESGEDSEAFNRLGKAYFELGNFSEARDAYQSALRLMPTNGIARKNLDRLENLLARAGTAGVPDRSTRELVDLRMFITETGRTAVTSLIDVTRNTAVDAIVTSEKVVLNPQGRVLLVMDAEGNEIGRVEPKLAQRLNELMAGGNRYVAAVAQNDGKQLRILIRETYQDPSQRGRVSFPGKFGEGALRGYIGASAYDEYGEDLLEEDESAEEDDTVEEEVYSGDEEELGLDDIEKDIGEDEDMNEE